MENNSRDTVEEERILYELFVPFVWPEQASFSNAGLEGKDGAMNIHTYCNKMIAAFRNCGSFMVNIIKNSLRTVGLSVPYPPTILIQLMSAQLPWLLALSSDGKQLAVVRDECIEIRSILDGFEIARVSCKVDRDQFPQWRRTIWNDQGTQLAYASCSGQILIYSHSGQLLHNLCSSRGSVRAKNLSDDVYLGEAVSGMMFFPLPAEMRAEEKWPTQMFAVARFKATIETCLLKSFSGNCLHCVSLLDYFSSGIGAVHFDSLHNILIIAGWAEQTGHSEGSPLVSCWRLVLEAPYWVPAPGQEVKKEKRSRVQSLLGFPKKHVNKDWVFALSVSPSGSMLATLSISGQLSLWDLPSLRLQRHWVPDQLPGFKVGSHCHFRQGAPMKGFSSVPVEVCWWSEDALIIGSSVEEVVVPSIHSMANLLGSSPEPGTRITHASNGQFLMLECESEMRVVGQRGLLPSLSDDSIDGDEEKDEPKDLSLRQKSSEMVKQVMYFLTEREQFRPRRERHRQVYQKYRLICLKSMPPDECYERKMENEEYGEALELARRYGLDCNRVYQRQWAESQPFTAAAISDYLSRVDDWMWILQECVQCIAKDFLTMRELLDYGLQRCSFRQLADMRPDSLDQAADDSLNGANAGDGSGMDPALSPELTTGDIVKIVARWKMLSEDQVALCQFRDTLLLYLGRLETYEMILGGSVAADEGYDSEFYELFRKQNLVRAVVNFAQDGNWRAVKELFSFHGADVLPHRLAIISNFPETLSPTAYRTLLPAQSEEGVMADWEGIEEKEIDWVEHPSVRKMYSLGRQISSSSGFLYEDSPQWKPYCVEPLSGQLLTTWYSERAMEIEKLSGQIDNALALVDCGQKNGIQGLETLQHHLKTLSSLVYYCNADIHLNLTSLQDKSHLEVVQLLMKDVDSSSFLKSFSQHVVPYLQRLEHLRLDHYWDLLEEFMVIVSKNDLHPCLQLIESSKRRTAHVVKMNIQQRTSLALKCVYACERFDQLDEADSILQLLPAQTSSMSSLPKELASLHRELDELEDYVSAADILKSYGILKSIRVIRDIHDNKKEVEQLLIRLARSAGQKQPQLTESGWRGLLQHLMALRTRAFSCISQDKCYKIFSEALLCSGDLESIELAGQVLTTTVLASSDKPVASQYQGFTFSLPYEISVQVVVSSAREYFNSASTADDREMELARACLSLMASGNSPHPDVIAELNLIESIGVLTKLGLSQLPVQVRLCADKLDLIKEVLSSTATAYKKYGKIFNLSYLLGVSKESETTISEITASASGSDGLKHTALLIAQSALQNLDFKLSSRIARWLVSCHFSSAWKLSRELGTNSQFTDKSTKLLLLDFAVCHCPSEEIRAVIADRKLLATRLKYEDCFGLSERGGLIGRGSVAVQQIFSMGTGAMQQLIGQRAVETSALGGDAILHACLNHLQELSRSLDEKRSLSGKIKSIISVVPGHHPFYDKKAEPMATYSKWREMVVKTEIVVRQMILTVGVDMECSRALSNVESESSMPREEVTQALLKLAEGHADMDSMIFIGYLLSLPTPQLADGIFSRMAPSKFSFLLAMYFCCLHIYCKTTQPLTLGHPYQHPPLKLIQHVLGHVTTSDECDWPADLQPVLKMLNHYKELLEDHIQAHTLKSLGMGIDVERFMLDNTYKKETVLQLARNEKDKVFSTSLLLAVRHKISLWDIYFTHLDWLLADSGFSSREIQKRLSDGQLMEKLLLDPQKTADQLKEVTYSRLPATDYGIFYQYYTFLQWCGEKGASIHEHVGLASHLSLLKKFKSAIRGVDYRLLMSGGQPLTILLPSLADNNVHVVAKMAKVIPISEEEGFLTAEKVYAAFAEKLFWQGDKKTTLPAPENEGQWLKHQQACSGYLQRLSAQPFIEFVRATIFSEQSTKSLSHNVREALLAELVAKSAARASLDEGPQTHDKETYASVTIQLKQYQKHLSTLRSPVLQQPPRRISDQAWSKFLVCYDLSLSNIEMVEHLLIQLCQLGASLSVLEAILSLCQSVCQHSLTVAVVLKKSLSLALSGTKSNQQSVKEVAAVVEKVLMVVSEHEEEGGGLVTSENVVGVLQPICGDPSCPSSLKRVLLDLMNKHLTLSSEDFSTLLVYQAESLLSARFSYELTESDLATSAGQERFFLSLLQQATSLDHLDALVELLQSWPESSSVLLKCWNQLLRSLCSYEQGCKQVPELRARLSSIDPLVEEELYILLLAKDKNAALQLAFMSDHQPILQQALDLIQHQLSPQELVSAVDSTTLELVIQRRQVPLLLSTPLYSQLYSHLTQVPGALSGLNVDLLSLVMRCNERELAEELNLDYPSERLAKVAHQLCEAGLHVEAGSLFYGAQAIHPGLLLVNSVLQALTSKL